jgi:hypothetical protein
MGQGGLEPPTVRLGGACSIHLSYRPGTPSPFVFPASLGYGRVRSERHSSSRRANRQAKVWREGIEPSTPRLSDACSNRLSYHPSRPGRIRTCDQELRTCDQELRRLPLCPLSYRPKRVREDSNLRPAAPQAAALSTELRIQEAGSGVSSELGDSRPRISLGTMPSPARRHTLAHVVRNRQVVLSWPRVGTRNRQESNCAATRKRGPPQATSSYTRRAGRDSNPHLRSLEPRALPVELPAPSQRSSRRARRQDGPGRIRTLIPSGKSRVSTT